MIQITLHWVAWLALAAVFSMAAWEGAGRLIRALTKFDGCPNCDTCGYCNQVAGRGCTEHSKRHQYVQGEAK